MPAQITVYPLLYALPQYVADMVTLIARLDAEIREKVKLPKRKRLADSEAPRSFKFVPELH